MIGKGTPDRDIYVDRLYHLSLGRELCLLLGVWIFQWGRDPVSLFSFGRVYLLSGPTVLAPRHERRVHATRE